MLRAHGGTRTGRVIGAENKKGSPRWIEFSAPKISWQQSVMVWRLIQACRLKNTAGNRVLSSSQPVRGLVRA